MAASISHEEENSCPLFGQKHPIQPEEEEEEQTSDVGENSGIKTEKKRKCGIVYLATIPPTMNVSMIREKLEKFGEIGRVFLQPSNKGLKKRPSKTFTEGWVEFKSKRRAKLAAETLNNQQVGGRKRHAYYDSIWNIKYLSGFKWAHLSERLAYERAVQQQRLRQEIAQVKRETNFYSQAVDRSAKLRRVEEQKRKKGEAVDEPVRLRHVTLREPLDEPKGKKIKTDVK